jgi:phosphatidylserine/phosphatidylglycerophosphate/cardiolipin synthase-like enzyme
VRWPSTRCGDVVANTAVTGRVVDSTGAPRPGLQVRAYENDVWPFRDFLGEATTGASGEFTVTYEAARYGPAEKLPDIVVEIRQGGAVIFATKETTDVTEDVLDLGELTLTGKNIGVQGRVVDEVGEPISGMVVIATDIDTVSKDDVLGRTVTAGDGTWSLTYPPSVYEEVLGDRPDIVVTVLDRVGIRQLAETAETPDVTSSVLVVDDIVVARAVADGWAATLGGETPSRLSTGNRFDVLVDNQSACREMINMIEAATIEVHIAQLWIDDDFIATYTDDGPVATNATRPEHRILDSLLEAGKRPGITVRLLLNENAVTPDTVDEVTDWFEKRQPHNVRVRAFPLTYETMHAKMLITDPSLPGAKVMIIGSPFEQGYWDTPGHLVIEPRRGSRALEGIGARPVHDVSIVITGPGTADVADTFAMLWNHRSDVAFNGADKLPDPGPRPAPAGGQSMQMVRTLPRKVLPGLPGGEVGVLEAYQRALGAAADVIYLENQYFSSAAIVRALRRAMADNEALQVVLLINEHPDIPTYRGWQNRRLLKEIGLPHPQLGVFTLWRTGVSAGQVSIQQAYVHAKVGIVDTRWATVGTANLDGISMEAAAELPFGSRRRSVEANSVLFDGIAGQPATGAVAQLRSALWSEHLGQLPSARPPGGWLSLWEQRAAANVASLNADPPSMSQGRILPYRQESSARSQLEALGINTDRLVILD